MSEETNPAISSAFLEIVKDFNASPEDLEEIKLDLLNASETGDGVELDVTNLSERRQRMLTRFLFALSGQEQKPKNQMEEKNHETEKLPIAAVNHENLGTSASRVLLFLMSEDAVEARVGDLLEALPRIQNRYGTAYGLLHFWWSVGCFSAAAIWGNTPIAKAISAWLGNREGS